MCFMLFEFTIRPIHWSSPKGLSVVTISLYAYWSFNRNFDKSFDLLFNLGTTTMKFLSYLEALQEPTIRYDFWEDDHDVLKSDTSNAITSVLPRRNMIQHTL